MTNEVECLCMCLLAIVDILLCEVPVQVLCPFSIRLSFSYYIVVVLYI